MSSRAQAIISELLTHTNSQVAKNAARALAILAGREDFERLVNLAVEHPDSELGKEAFALIRALPTEKARVAAGYVMSLLESPKHWLAAYRLLTAVDPTSWRRTVQRPPWHHRLYLAVRANVIFAFAGLRGRLGRTAALCLLGALVAAIPTNMLLFWLWFDDLGSPDAEFTQYTVFTYLASIVALLLSRVLLSPIAEHPFRSVVLGVQSTVIAVAGGSLLALTTILLCQAFSNNVAVVPLLTSVSCATALAAGTTRIVAAIARSAAPRGAAPKLLSFIVTAIACSFLLVIYLSTVESFVMREWSAKDLRIEHLLFATAWSVLISFSLSFSLLDSEALRRFVDVIPARVLLVSATATLLVLDWLRGNRSPALDTLACNWSVPGTSSRYDYYPSQLPASIGVVVQAGTGRILAAMPELRGKSPDYEVIIKTQLTSPKTNVLAPMSFITSDDPPLAAFDAGQGNFLVTGGFSGTIRETSTRSGDPARAAAFQPLAQTIAKRFGLWNADRNKLGWQFATGAATLISIACGPQDWPRKIATGLRTWPLTIGDTVIVKKPETAISVLPWTTAMGSWIGRPMTVTSFVGAGLFRVRENDLMWETDWVAERRSAENNAHSTDIKVITPIGIYQVGADVLKRNDEGGTKYHIQKIRDAVDESSASGYIACIQPASTSTDQTSPLASSSAANSVCALSDEPIDLADLTLAPAPHS